MHYGRLTESLAKGNGTNDIECITLKPVSKIKRYSLAGELVQAVHEYFSTVIHERLVVDQRAHGVQTSESLPRVG